MSRIYLSRVSYDTDHLRAKNSTRLCLNVEIWYALCDVTRQKKTDPLQSNLFLADLLEQCSSFWNENMIWIFEQIYFGWSKRLVKVFLHLDWFSIFWTTADRLTDQVSMSDNFVLENLVCRVWINFHGSSKFDRSKERSDLNIVDHGLWKQLSKAKAQFFSFLKKFL